jgi:hypothetical protein
MKTEIKIIKKYNEKELESAANKLLKSGWRVRGNLVVVDVTFYLMLTRSIQVKC